MAGLMIDMDSVCTIEELKEKVPALDLGIRESEKAIHRDAIVKVLDRAADDPAFIAELTYQGSKTLQGHNLTLEEKAALLSGDINWIEAHIGKLDERLSTWLWCRLQQEIW
jgi:hypothetical protein